MTKVTVTMTFDSMEDARAWLGDETRAATPEPAPAPAPAPNVPEARAVEPSEPVSPTVAPGEVEVDDQGMPYDPAIHTTTRTKNADGTWKALRGKADEAKAARAEFLARGGPGVADVMPGTEAPAPAPAPAPVAAPPAGMPGMPGVEVAREVSIAELVGKTTELMGSNVLTKEALKEHYNAIGLTSPDQFADDPALRLAMMERLEAI